MSTTTTLTIKGLEARVYLDYGVNTTGGYGILFDENADTVAETETLRYSGYCTACVVYREFQRLINWRRGIEPHDIHQTLDLLNRANCTCDDEEAL